MATIQTILAKYRPKIDNLDLELIIAHELKKSRELVLAYPETELTKKQETRNKQLITRRLKHEPLAYILGRKEFYGLDFRVTKDTLIPRPETELLVEQALQKIPAYAKAPAGKQDTRYKKQRMRIIDVGTGSGNIIISIAKNSDPAYAEAAVGKQRAVNNKNIKYFATDISEKALKVAKHNAKKHNLTKIKFIKSDLLDYFLKNNTAIKQSSNLIILANLPYLSNKIYQATELNVKNFEPKSTLYSPKEGLAHYEKLLKQINLLIDHCSLITACLPQPRRRQVHCFLEISPEQKKALTVLIKKILPSVKIEFKKDLAGKWRVCVISLN